jgi:hypothetical protein
MGYLKPIMPKFYLLALRWALAYNLTHLPNLSIIFSIFFHNVLDAAQITTSFNCKPPPCVCTHPIDLINIHLLFCTHSNKYMRTHDAVHDTFVTIVKDSNFHMG